MTFLLPLKLKDSQTYEHCLRVGILSRMIGQSMHLDEKALLYAGLLHDLGKILTDLKTLQKTEGWTDRDTEEVKSHVVDGYRMLRGRFDFTAEVILWHHRFQAAGYPKALPRPLHEYRQGTKLLHLIYGRIVAIADQFDALHRINDKSGVKRALSEEEIRQAMFEHNPDMRVLITELYNSGILPPRFNQISI
jgi:putative nucleotidyltransferase with HDIG domain